MKYIMFETELDNGLKQRIPIIFPDIMVHSQVARSIGHHFRREHDMDVTPVSAGFIRLGDCSVHGESETLKLSANSGDGQIIRNYWWSKGIEEKSIDVPPELLNGLFGDPPK